VGAALPTIRAQLDKHFAGYRISKGFKDRARRDEQPVRSQFRRAAEFGAGCRYIEIRKHESLRAIEIDVDEITR
jgi:hypothetical protein